MENENRKVIVQALATHLESMHRNPEEGKNIAFTKHSSIKILRTMTSYVTATMQSTLDCDVYTLIDNLKE